MYKLKYINLTDEQIEKIKEMRIPENADDSTDEKQWVKNAIAMNDSGNRQTEEAIKLFLLDEFE